MDLVVHPAVARHQRIDECDVAIERSRNLRAPRVFEGGITNHRRGHHEAGRTLVDIALRQLRVRKPGAMAHQFVRQRAAHAL